MPDPNYTHINVVLDRSGSMGLVRDDTIGGFNTFLAGQQALPGKATFTLLQFDDVLEHVQKFVPLNEARPLTKETYIPRNMTALLDAVGTEIEATGQTLKALAEPQRPGKVLFVILTDGQENASKIVDDTAAPVPNASFAGFPQMHMQPQRLLKYRLEKLSALIQHQRDTYKWEFIFIGANQDAIATASAMHISTGNTMSYAANSMGTRGAFASAGKMSHKFRSTSTVAGSAAAANLVDDEDRKWQEDAGVNKTP